MVCDQNGNLQTESSAFGTAVVAAFALFAWNRRLHDDISCARSENAEMMRVRMEDCKANEKVMHIFATQEQSWKSERRLLKQKLQKLQLHASSSSSVPQICEPHVCPECVAKEARISEQDLLIMATAEETLAEEREKNKLAAKLAGIELKHLQLETEMNSLQTELSALREGKAAADSLARTLSSELASIKSIHQQTVSNMHSLERELIIAKAKHRHAEDEREKWRRIVAEMRCCRSERSITDKPRNSVSSTGSRSADSGFYLIMNELQRSHDGEMNNMQTEFEEHVRALQNRLSLYETDGNVVPCLERGLKLKKNGVTQASGSKEMDFVGKMLPVFSMDHTDRHSDADRTKDSEGKWKKLYMAAKAALEALQREKGVAGVNLKSQIAHDWSEAETNQRHRQEFESAERLARAKDERMEAFRRQLLDMEKEAAKRSQEITTLTKAIQVLTEEKKKAESGLLEREAELAIRRKGCCCEALRKRLGALSKAMENAEAESSQDEGIPTQQLSSVKKCSQDEPIDKFVASV